MKNNMAEKIANRIASARDEFFSGKKTVYSNDIYDFGTENGKHIYIYDAGYDGENDLYKLVSSDNFADQKLYKLDNYKDYFKIKYGEAEPEWREVDSERQMPSMLEQMIEYLVAPIDFYDMMDAFERNGYNFFDSKDIIDGSAHGTRYYLAPQSKDADFDKLMADLKRVARYPEKIKDGGDVTYRYYRCAPELQYKTIVIEL